MNDSAARLSRGGPCGRAAAGLALLLGLGLAARAQTPAAAAGSIGPIQIFFPPEPPPLGFGLAPGPAAVPRWPAPPGLAPFAGDPFYAPLSTRMAKNALSSEIDFQLQAYRASKAALQTELHARLDTLKDADADTRQQSLEAFAREQTPRIAELETTAETLRRNLRASRVSANEYIRWLVDFASDPTPKPEEVPARFRELASMDASYQAGLSPAQRRLLREVALAPIDPAGDWYFFSPDTARIHLPAHLPAPLADQIAAYEKKKAALKAALLAVLYPNLKVTSGSARAFGLRALAESQAPEFEALELQAEAIRRGLALLKDPAESPQLPALPAGLADRIASYRRDKLALQKDLLAKVEAVKGEITAADRDLLAGKIREAIAAYTRDNADRYAALEKNKDAIRDDLARLPGPGPAAPGGGAGSADVLVKKFSESLQQLQTYWDYRDYQTAVFQPGLSPEQRRLLFNGALEKLALPLPGAQIDPVR